MNYFIVFLMIIEIVLLVFIFFYLKQTAWLVAKIAAQFLYDPDMDPKSLSCVLSDMQKTLEEIRKQDNRCQATSLSEP